MAGWLDSIFGGGEDSPSTGGGGGGWLGTALQVALPAAIKGVSGYFGQQGAANDALADRDFKANQSQLDRDFQMQLLKTKLDAAAAAGGGGGGGGGGGIDPRVLIQNAMARAQQTKLDGAQLPIGAITNMVTAIQRGLGQIK